jgi:hypothetical protein
MFVDEFGMTSPLHQGGSFRYAEAIERGRAFIAAPRWAEPPARVMRINAHAQRCGEHGATWRKDSHDI